MSSVPEIKDLQRFWNEHSEWSQATFGTDAERGPIGALRHLAKEVQEVLHDPTDLEEFADCLFLLFDAARRAGFTLPELTDMAFTKLAKNRTRIWVKNEFPDQPTEHLRGVND